MRRYLVVAHRTLGGDHLMDHVRSLREQGPCRFLLLVPVEHPVDHMWTEGEVKATARRRLQEGLDLFHEQGIIADGEVGDANPVYAVSTVVRREGPDAFTGIILSTLPTGPSRWLRWDVPSRLRREHPELPITHLVADRVHAH
jgi:GABA permease